MAFLFLGISHLFPIVSVIYVTIQLSPHRFTELPDDLSKYTYERRMLSQKIDIILLSMCALSEVKTQLTNWILI